MDKNLLKKAIQQQLDAISEQFEIIKQHDSKVPQIELDIILSNIRKMYEFFYELNKTNGESSTTAKKAVKPVEKEKVKPSATPPPVVNLTEDKAKDDPPKTLKPAPEPPPEKKVKTTPPPKVKKPEPPISETVIPLEVITDEPTESPEDLEPDEITPEKSTIDLFSEHGTLADKLMNEDETIADKIGKLETTDLKKVIGINEKFLFLNELFDGNMSSYEQAIDALNRCGNMDEVKSLILKYHSAYGWDPENEAYVKFITLLERKFK